MKKALVLTMFFIVTRVQAQWVVYDPTVWWQTVINTLLVSNQLEHTTLIVDRMGDPAAIREVIGANGIIAGIVQAGTGQTLDQLQMSVSGTAAFWYDGNGLYRVIQDSIATPDGKFVKRAADGYKKYDAVNLTTTDFKAVHDDTETRRLMLLNEIKATTEQTVNATTDAEVQKLQAIAASQATLLGAIDRERDAALGRVAVQDIENRNDEAKQQQARKEERIIDFKEASGRFTQFLSPDTSTMIIPATRSADRLPLR